MLNYDGFDLSPYLTVNAIGRPLLPPQILSIKSISGRDGVYFFRKRSGAIIIPVSVTIHVKTIPDYRKRVRFLASKFNKDEPKPMIFSDEPEMFINGIVQDESELEEVLETGQGDISFLCPDPFYYAIENEVFTYVSAGDYNFTRELGNTESYPYIEIEGSNSGGLIMLETDNAKINFDGDLAIGETLVFDSDLITSFIIQTDGTQRSGNNNIDSMDFPVLVVGANNIKVSVTGGASVKSIKVYAHSRWI